MSSSGTTHKMRQPGRLLTPYDPGNCQVCDPNFGIPGNTIALIVTGTGYPCCSIDLDSPPEHFMLTALADPCLKDSSGNKVACTWQYTVAEAGLYIRYSVTLECVGGVAQLNFSIDEVDASGNFIESVASGQYLPSGGCGAVDCSQLNGAGGHLTLYGGNVCNPGFPGCANNASWSVLLGTGICPESRANECCCGGQPPPPCFHVCVTDPACASPGNVATDVRVCQTSSNHYEGIANGISVTMDYSTSTGWTIAWTCTAGAGGNAGGSVTIGPGDPGWTIINGQLHLHATGDGWTIDAGPRAQCLPTCACCTPWDVNWELDWDLTDAGFPASTDSGACISHTTAEALWTLWQYPPQGCCANWMASFLSSPYGPVDPVCGQLVTNINLNVILSQQVNGPQCQFTATVTFCCVNQGGLAHNSICGTPACPEFSYTYVSDWLDPQAACAGPINVTYSSRHWITRDPGPPSNLTLQLEIISA